MQSSALLPSQGGAAISSIGFDTRGWYQLSAFPSTVLAGVQQSNEYPDLYYGQPSST